MTETPRDYIMGHTDRERRRLALQAAILNPLTDSFLRRAGISAGMRVLDLGCGTGEVSLIAARWSALSQERALQRNLQARDSA